MVARVVRKIRLVTSAATIVLTHFNPRIHSVNILVSADVTCGNGGMMMGPHLPEPPLWICCSTFAAASGSDLYFIAISRYAGPTIFVLALWHPRQPYLAATCGPSAAGPRAGRVCC